MNDKPRTARDGQGSADPLGSVPVIDARVRLPSTVRPTFDETAEFYDRYDAVLGVSDEWDQPLDTLRSEMANAGISHAIVHAEYEDGDLADPMNEELAELVASEPELYSGFGTVTLQPLRVMRAVRQVERIHELGLLGVNVQPAFFGLSIDAGQLYPIYAKATELGLAVAIHTGVNYSRSHPIEPERPVYLDRVACDFPETTLIACHGGWPWIPEMVAVARRHPNVLIDFGGLAPKYVGVAGSGWELMRRFMDRVLRDQILFASDWPVFPQRRAIMEWHELGLRPETVAALMGGNAERTLLSRVPSAPA